MVNEHLDPVPLCVDLDGTLIKSDMLYESLLRLLKFQPWCLFLLPFWLLRGKANLKARIADRVDMSEVALPFNQDVVEFLAEAKKQQKIILVTGTHQSIAESVAKQQNIFDEVVGSSHSTNLTGGTKRDWLLNRFGRAGFDYIGNEKADIPVWVEARNALVVTDKRGIPEAKNQVFSTEFLVSSNSIKDYAKLIRMHQWSKNALIFVPFLLEYRLNDTQAFLAIVLAFFAMSFLASATYIINDMLDLSSDRENETKKNRMLASGKISLIEGFVVMVLLFFVTMIMMFFLNLKLSILLLVYLVSTLTYSFLLKQLVILDVVCIAALHTLRVIAGTVAIQAQWSFWLLAFSMFLFFSLATAKRVAELENLKRSESRSHTIGRDYHVSDIPMLQAMGVSTSFLSVLIVALYINSEKVLGLYTNPALLWLLCPVLMYWVGRIWLITSRGGMHEDPIVFAMRDKISFLTVLSLGTIVFTAMFLGF